MKTNNWEEELKKLMGYTTNEEMASRMEFISQDFRDFNKVCDFIKNNFVHKDEVEKVSKLCDYRPDDFNKFNGLYQNGYEVACKVIKLELLKSLE